MSKYTKRYICIALLFAFFVSSQCMQIIPVADSSSAKEFRGVWVSTVLNLDYPSSATVNSAALKTEADSTLEDIKDMGMNAVILQVRPASDSLYPSEIFPWSQYLTGSQNTAPMNNFDVLEYWVTRAHELGLELHAWINPYRVAMSESAYNAMSSNHPAKQNPEWVVKHTDGRYYFDPGIPSVQQLVLDGAMEIVKNYDIDGLHMDDYFYPDANFADDVTYAAYGGDFDNVGDWRRNNVNTLVKKLHDEIKAVKPDVSFGISPAGIWANKSSLPQGSDTNGNETYFSHFADTLKWIEEGWVDYICPQLYWNIGHAQADYETLARWWANAVKGTGVELYIGMADYQAGNSDSSSPWYGIDEIKRQITLNSTLPEISGEAHFRYKFLRDNSNLYNYYKQMYNPSQTQSGISFTVPTYVNGLKTDEHIPYMSGDAGNFMPAKTMTRAEASVMLARLMTDSSGNLIYDNYSGTSSFKDVPKDSWYASAVALMEERGIITGYDDGTFKPFNNLTRGEFAAIASRFTDMQNLSSSGFADADAHWSKAYVANAVHYGFINGYDDGTFKPANSLTRSEAVAIVNRMLGRAGDKDYIAKYVSSPYKDVTSSYWAYHHIIEASVEHYYVYIDGVEHWSAEPVDSSGNITVPETPQIPTTPPTNEELHPFVSDTFEFVRPDLKVNGQLEPLNLADVDTIVVHHMAHPTAGFEAIRDGHLAQGWVTIGYNFWIGFDGQIYVGRGWNVPAAVLGHNYHTINIGFQGDYETYNSQMPAAQYEAGVKLIKWLSDNLESAKYFGGHGDLGPTVCPGTMFPYEEFAAEAEKIGLIDLRK